MERVKIFCRIHVDETGNQILYKVKESEEGGYGVAGIMMYDDFEISVFIGSEDMTLSDAVTTLRLLDAKHYSKFVTEQVNSTLEKFPQ